MNEESLFPLPTPSSARLTAMERTRMIEAGCSASELTAVSCIASASDRALLIDFFCDAAPMTWRKLQFMLSLVLYKVKRGDMRPIGGDIITNAARFHFRECEGSNDHRLLYPRALLIVLPSLKPVLAMGNYSKANVLLESGWQAPSSVKWNEIEAAKL